MLKIACRRTGWGFLDDVQNINSNCRIIMWAGTYNFLMNRGYVLIEMISLKMYKKQTYCSHGAPCSVRDLNPPRCSESESTLHVLYERQERTEWFPFVFRRKVISTGLEVQFINGRCKMDVLGEVQMKFDFRSAWPIFPKSFGPCLCFSSTSRVLAY